MLSSSLYFWVVSSIARRLYLFLYIALSISEHLQLSESFERTIALRTYYSPQSIRASHTIKVLDLNNITPRFWNINIGPHKSTHTLFLDTTHWLDALSRTTSHLHNPYFPFLSYLIPDRSPFAYITYLWNVLVFSRDFHKVP